MKAKEYYTKYKDDIISTDDAVSAHAIACLVNDMKRETIDIIRQRKCVKFSTCAAVIKEMNQKYNAVCSLFEKDYGATPIIYDGLLVVFKGNFLKDFPGIERYLPRVNTPAIP